MKKIVLELPPYIDLIEVSQLQLQSESCVVIYKRQLGKSYCMLARLNVRSESYLWGFIPLDELFSKPAFTGANPEECIRQVIIAKRDVRIFKNLGEFFQRINENKF